MVFFAGRHAQTKYINHCVFYWNVEYLWNNIWWQIYL